MPSQGTFLCEQVFSPMCSSKFWQKFCEGVVSFCYVCSPAFDKSNSAEWSTSSLDLCNNDLRKWFEVFSSYIELVSYFCVLLVGINGSQKCGNLTLSKMWNAYEVVQSTESTCEGIRIRYLVNIVSMFVLTRHRGDVPRHCYY
ncbi:hypothetical protein O6H91_06G146700 [Diphasiastrum complanatum]|uniref:Uncharacterized protein n=1 Tax=Diphasiastrum complanatum TaxID=34168 RepID=A0ACC2DJS0_DIPCM|nr:hypothetical protein O6H91_06G146700 [Diphasiastrum complanatum]